MKPLVKVAVTIANNTASSSAVETNGRRLVAVQTPAAWTAADITFDVYDAENAQWLKIVDAAGAAVKITGVATGAAEINLPPEIGDRLTYNRMRLTSTNTASEADVNQGAARTLYVILGE